MSKTKHIRNLIKDTISNFFYYDRKEDEDLPLGTIEDMISTGEITLEQIKKWFAEELDNAV